MDLLVVVAWTRMGVIDVVSLCLMLLDFMLVDFQAARLLLVFSFIV